ncbi:aminotransferase-like domain-containing protein [Nonomuraea sp. KM90]|uniref:aminotransferase-like domain-containing protein n=1 Tax=Nonomuraea sp. KM90 TaxID=3457428 RepID=UPI003FCC5EEA
MRHPQRLDVPIQLARDVPEPLQDQLAAQLRSAIARGRLAPRTRMPSTRTLALVLGISRGVALAAYERLLAEGHISSRWGSGTYVSDPDHHSDAPVPNQVRHSGAPARDQVRHSGTPAPNQVRRSGTPAPDPVPGSRPHARDASHRRPAGLIAAGGGEAVIDLRSDRHSAQGFPSTARRAAWLRAGRQAPPLDAPPAGLPALRAAIGAYLRDTRGLVLDGHEVIVTADVGDALELVLRAQGGPDPVIALEDPAPPALRAALGRLGTVLPLPTDGAGARPDRIPGSCDIVAVLPERGAPLGTRMTVERRRALAAWARDSGGLVLEPAFDGLFNAALGPRPSVLALGDAWSTAMVGSFRDVLTPTLRLSFAVVPRRLAGEIEDGMSAGPSFSCQLAVTDLLTSGCVAGRAEHLTTLYAVRRAIVRQALGAYPGTRLLGAHTGAAATLLLPADLPATSVIRLLRARRVQVTELAAFHHPDGAPGNGIVFSYGHLNEVSLCRALHAMTRTLDDHRLARRTAA